MRISTVSSSSSSSSGMIGSKDFIPAIENLSLSSPPSSSSSSSSSSAETSSSSFIDKVIGNIVLLTLILICLPVKSLLVFKSVSKQWFSLISDPIFAVNHFRRFNPKTSGSFFERLTGFVSEDEYYEVKYDFLLHDGTNTTVAGRDGGGFKILRKFGDDDPEPGKYGSVGEYRFRISQSCNGLLCCNRETKIDGGDSMRWDISTYKTYIYNPTTTKYRCLPPSPFRDNIPPELDDTVVEVCSISLAFDPIKSLDHNYEVICIWRYIPNRREYEYWDADVHGKLYIEIYSSRTNSWKKLNSSYTFTFDGRSCGYSRSGVYWNGCLHWIAYHNWESPMYFDIEQELVKPLPASPNGTTDQLFVTYFGECGGHLYLIEFESYCDTHLNIFKMEIDYSAWKRTHRLDVERLVALYPGNDPLEFHPLFFCRAVLFLEEDEAESLSKLVVVVSGDKVISYDLKEMSFTEIHTFPEQYFYLEAPACISGAVECSVHHYVESLACV